MKKEDAIKYLQQLYPNGGHCWLDEQRIEAIGMAIKALQEEPVSEDLGEVGSLKSLEYYPEKKTINKTSKGVFDANMPRRKAYLRGFKDGAHAHKELIANKPVSDDLGEYINELSKQFPEVSFAKLSRIAVRVAKWQEQQMMAKAIDGKVIANGMGNPILHLWDKGRHLIGKKVKVIVIEEG